MRISDRLMQLKPSATMAISSKAMDLRAQGREILSLSVGEPDMSTPEHICEAAKKAIDERFTRYTQVPGIPELRKAAAGYYKRMHNTDAAMEEVIISNGGKQGLYNFFQASLNPGDEVIIPAPYWVSYPALVQLAGGEPVIVPAQAEKNFKVTASDLEKAVTPKTRCLLLNSPSNPTGCMYSQEELDELVSFAVDKGLLVLSDEIYDQMVFAPAKPASAGHWFNKVPEQIILANGVSKTFAMTGWRVGYMIACADMVKAMSKLQGQSTSNVCSIAQRAALAALEGPMDFMDDMCKALVRRRDMLLDVMSGWPGVICPKPEGAFYLFPKVDAYYKNGVENSTDLCAKLLEEAGVALVPGAAFGDDTCIRFSYALDDETLAKAMDKVGSVLLK